MPFRNGYYDTMISISTLEHVGMDNTRYGGPPAEGDPDVELATAVAELKRVLAPGGQLLVTVPYGCAEDHGWFRQLDRAAVDMLVQALAPRDLSVTVYAYSRNGWQRSSLTAAATSRYHDSTIETRAGDDLAVAARAVACLRATV